MKVAYSDACSLGLQEFVSLRKPGHLFRMCFDAQRDTLVPSPPANERFLVLAHDARYVDDVLALRLSNGFGNRRAEVLRQILAANGALRAAVQEALRSGICFAPVSGFHHAGHAFNGGFCTFNALVASAVEAGVRTLIIDGDGHYGDGTDDCIAAKGLTDIVNLTAPTGTLTAAAHLAQIREALAEDWGLVIYQAGADAHQLDRFGAGYLSDDDWRARDRLVFQTCRDRGIPIAWNLAGGYSEERTFNLHYDTFVTASEIYEPNLCRERLTPQNDLLGRAETSFIAH